MTQSPAMKAKDARLLRALAAALTADPATPYQRLAEAGGVSRRTLYRVAPSREALFERLRREAIDANFAALARADIESGPFPTALHSLTTDFIVDSELYGFWAADTWGGAASGPPTELDSDMIAYREAMTRFFERGQREGHVRPDMPPAWLVVAYDALLLAAAGSLRSGKVAPADLTRLVMDSLIQGIGTPVHAVSA